MRISDFQFFLGEIRGFFICYLKSACSFTNNIVFSIPVINRSRFGKGELIHRLVRCFKPLGGEESEIRSGAADKEVKKPGGASPPPGFVSLSNSNLRRFNLSLPSIIEDENNKGGFFRFSRARRSRRHLSGRAPFFIKLGALTALSSVTVNKVLDVVSTLVEGVSKNPYCATVIVSIVIIAVVCLLGVVLWAWIHRR